MTRSEAEARCTELARDHPERDRFRWVPRESDQGWTVVRIPLPESLVREPLTPVIEAKPRPQQADDPRPAHIRNVPGGWG
jgi:hypothetical protein